MNDVVFETQYVKLISYKSGCKMKSVNNVLRLLVYYFVTLIGPISASSNTSFTAALESRNKKT